MAGNGETPPGAEDAPPTLSDKEGLLAPAYKNDTLPGSTPSPLLTPAPRAIAKPSHTANASEAESEILLIGTSNSGKSLLSHTMKWVSEHKESGLLEIPAFSVRTTIGLERESVHFNGTKFVAMEVGGPMQANWPSYYSKCVLVLFVVDMCDKDNLANSFVALLDCLRHSDVANKPVFVLLNKTDVQTRLSRAEIEDFFSISELQQQRKTPLKVREISALRSTGVLELLQDVQTELLRPATPSGQEEKVEGA
mmetsp:Transcript_7251/g.13752  ORF Transcript_7251/g.13752 Transcript_7251/m.13752 type:complete len:252 (-) Transcript_7251:1504-2259(-)|eukprot:CAMPEP_0175126034 /NCGR_PEP_ID=MMETSP0087-20121206/3631_1 /TAXON_ID=136419 /ORGANISM="Unknown Unknown, Strain D1" /LENGTH=251 /DNA_ID=CAMNT_0016407905 /DNA_START=89 /DNA_END=844 /DNA_ORIENTATION=+